MKSLVLSSALLALALPLAAAPILTPATTTVGGIVNATQFIVGTGTNTFVLRSNTWPTVQGPNKAVDGIIGAGSKYLNLNVENTAVIFRGTVQRVASRLELWVAEDAVERDPASYTLYGTDSTIPSLIPGDTLALSAFNLISAGTLALPTTRDTVSDTTGFSQSIPIPNTTPYATYLIVFPTVKGPGANSMQISEVQLYDSGIIGVEQFDYADGPIADKNGGTFWNYKNFSPTGPSGTVSDWDNVTATPAVASGRLVTQNSSAKREYNGTPQEDGAVNDPSSVPSSVAKSVYYRVTVTTGATVPDSFGLSSYDFGTPQLFFGKRSGQTQFGIEQIGGSGTNSTLPAILRNTTYTLVARLNYATDSLALWVNPGLNADETSQLPAVTRTYTGINWSTAVRLSSSGGSAVTWDDLVVATSWDDLGTVVDTATDEDNGNLIGSVSLREAVKYSPTGSLITFLPGLSGQTITLNHTDGDMEIPGTLTIDASALPGGLTVSGNNTTRHFFVGSGKSLTLRGLTLTGGNGAGPMNNNNGGAIYSFGTLTLTHCTLSGNAASSSGGAIRNISTLTLTHCTLSGNAASFGGAIFSDGPATLTHCTLSGNAASQSGGAINNFSPLTLTNSIVAGNSLTGAGSGADIRNTDFVTLVGTNLVQSLVNDVGGSVTGTGTISTTDPKLSPLGSFGGPVQTMHPLIGSPAIDAAGTDNPGGTDARGFSRFVDGNASAGAQLDIGAVEAGDVRSVTTAVDEDNGPGGAGLSLREALALSTAPGSRIRFSPSLFSGPILLGSQLTIPATANGIFIDASNLSTPATISGNDISRVFNIPATATVAMHSVRIVNGTAPSFEDGGGILNAGTLSLLHATLSGNSVSFNGGGISNYGTLAITSSTLSGNSADSGGGIYNSGTLAVTRSTLSGNSADLGGGISNSGTLAITSSTLNGNSAVLGGGISNDQANLLQIFSSIVAGNTAPVGPDIDGHSALGSGNLVGPNDPLLAPLGDYGGPTQTMPPLPGSPAIDMGSATTAQTDQRGFPRSRDGDGNGTALPDIGAVEASLSAVANANNEGPGSLRQAVLDAAAQPGADTVYFTPAVTGPITLTTEILITDPTGGVTIDASNRPTGQTISGSVATPTRHFQVQAGSFLTLRGLTLIGGTAFDGGSILNSGSVILTQCTLSGNSASNWGGAISSGGILTLAHCTLSGNSASTNGGAISNGGTLGLTQCTLSGNFAISNGGAISSGGGGQVTLTNSIVAGNAAATGPDIYRATGSLTTIGVNLIGNLASSGLAAGSTVRVAAPKLSPLGDFGGPVQTLHPLIGSPAIDAIVTPDPGGTDARGFPRFVDGDDFVGIQLDIGAVEAGRISPVTSSAGDNSTGTLRNQIAAITEPGTRIIFNSTIAGQTILLGGTQLDIPATPGLFIDASDLSAPITISGSNASRVFNIPATATVAMHSVTIANGRAPNGTNATTGTPGESGGGIFNAGSLSLFSSTITNNRAGNGGSSATFDGGTGGSGGGIANSGKLALTACIVSNNFSGIGGPNSSNENGGQGGGGGGISHTGSSLTLTDCTLRFNETGAGGAGTFGGKGGDGGGISSGAPFTLTNCTLSSNRTGTGGNSSRGEGGGDGGGISSSAPFSLSHCTLAGNRTAGGTSAGRGGAIKTVFFSGVPYRLTACTIATNFTGTGNSGPGAGGGISGGEATLDRCIIARNTSGFSIVEDVSTNALIRIGANLLGSSPSGLNFSGPEHFFSADPLLAPLGDYGGPTFTMALRPGSPARNTGTGPARPTDQRGFPLVGLPDIGAYEAGNALFTNYRAFIQETLPATSTPGEYATTFDFDSDGASNELEWLAGTGVIDPASAFRPVTTRNAGGDLVITFPTLVGRTYRYQRSDDLTPASWITVEASTRAGTGSPESFVLPTTTPPRRFFRLNITQP